MADDLILIVEDNEKNMKLARDVLQFNGFRTLEATSAEAGIALAQEHRPDIILMDIQLPGIDGVTALGRLRSDPATAPIPVIALTAFAMKDDQRRLLGAGFNSYVAKPISIRELPVQVRACLEAARSSGGQS
jgi:two-component system, cell cycle response regulator DivK